MDARQKRERERGEMFNLIDTPPMTRGGMAAVLCRLEMRRNRSEIEPSDKVDSLSLSLSLSLSDHHASSHLSNLPGSAIAFRRLRSSAERALESRGTLGGLDRRAE